MWVEQCVRFARRHPTSRKIDAGQRPGNGTLVLCDQRIVQGVNRLASMGPRSNTVTRARRLVFVLDGCGRAMTV
jgi:hypothetical protein